MNLFSNERTSTFIQNKNTYVKNEILKLSNEQICNSSLDNLHDYFYEILKVNLIDIETDFNYVTHDAQETTIKQYNPLYHPGSPYKSEYYNINGYKIIYKIPFEGDINLLYLKPYTSYLSEFKVDNILNPTEEKEGQIIFSLEYEKRKLDSEENVLAFIEKEFNSHFKYYIEMIHNVNSDISNFNSSLSELINTQLKSRLEKAEDYLKLRQKLNIPLELNKNAPNIKPVRLKKVKKDNNLPFPKLKSSPIEYCISDTDYSNIKNVINLSCISMEKAARTFCKLQEEELRDVILAALNTHYMGNATGETFNKRGKTDIHIPFENKSAYIGECKIWTGQGLFLEAINQLFSYMRWRDTKTSLIIFNKKNKDFSKILDTIQTILSNHNLCINKLKIAPNEWQCQFKKSEDSNEIVQLNIIVYDLYIDEN